MNKSYQSPTPNNVQSCSQSTAFMQLNMQVQIQRFVATSRWRCVRFMHMRDVPTSSRAAERRPGCSHATTQSGK